MNKLEAFLTILAWIGLAAGIWRLITLQRGYLLTIAISAAWLIAVYRS